MENDYKHIEYLFVDGQEKEIANRLGSHLKATPKGLKKYFSNQGLSISSSQVLIEGDLYPRERTSKGFTFVLQAAFSGVFERDITLFARGSNQIAGSLKISVSPGLKITVRVYFQKLGSVNTDSVLKKYTSTASLNPIVNNLLAVSVVTGGPSFSLLNVRIKINEELSSFDEFLPSELKFDWDAHKFSNTLGTEDGLSSGASIIASSFLVLEGGGGLLYHSLTDIDASKCMSTCSLLSSSFAKKAICVACRQAPNNVFVPSNSTCMAYCPLNHKVLGSTCVPCSSDFCKDGDMPKFQIKNTDRYFTKYSAYSLDDFVQKDLAWFDGSKIKITDLPDDDYKVSRSFKNSKLA